VVPGNITLLELPSYSPELNPVERIRRYLRSHWLAKSVSPSLANITDVSEMAWNRFASNPAPGPFALRGRLGSSSARSVGDGCYPRPR
jgi:hypothetical protein